MSSFTKNFDRFVPSAWLDQALTKRDDIPALTKKWSLKPKLRSCATSIALAAGSFGIMSTLSLSAIASDASYVNSDHYVREVIREPDGGLLTPQHMAKVVSMLERLPKVDRSKYIDVPSVD